MRSEIGRDRRLVDEEDEQSRKRPGYGQQRREALCAAQAPPGMEEERSRLYKRRQRYVH